MSELQIDQRDLTTMTIDELAAVARAEYGLMAEHVAFALRHAIRSGEALLRAKESMSKGEWGRWVEDHVGISNAWGSQLARLAYYRSEIPAEVLQAGSITEARSYLKGLPPIQPPGPAAQVPRAMIDEAQRLRSEGASYAEISRAMEVNQGEVWRWLNPEKHRESQRRGSLKHQRKRRAADQALKQQQEQAQRRQLAKATGGELAKSYSLIRQALAALDKVATEQAGEAIRHLHKAEEAVVEAMRTERAA